jgi:hypothetical protein
VRGCLGDGSRRHFVFCLLFVLVGYFFLFVAAWAAYGLYRMLRATEASRKYLEAAREEEPLRLGHLSPPLRRLVIDTRLLRISLEGPIRDILGHCEGDINRSADDAESFDNMLMNVSRQLADWVVVVDRLSEADRERLIDMGASADPIRRALDEEGWSFERRNLEPEGRPRMDVRLRRIAVALEKIERSLQLPPSPYR